MLASSENDLAYRLSPFYTTSLGMGWPDSGAIGGQIALAMSSWEEWEPEGSFGAVFDAGVDQLNQCELGNAENEMYVVDEITYICLNSQWLQSNFGGPRGRSPVQLVNAVAFGPPALVAWQVPGQLASLASLSQIDPCSMSDLQRGAAAVAADVGIGAGLIKAFSLGWIEIVGGHATVAKWALIIGTSGIGSVGFYAWAKWTARAC